MGDFACSEMQAVETGEAKANGPFAKTFVSAILAGAYVGFGAMLALSIGGNCPELAASNPGLQKMVFGAFGLPVGLLMVSLCSRPPPSPPGSFPISQCVCVCVCVMYVWVAAISDCHRWL